MTPIEKKIFDSYQKKIGDNINTIVGWNSVPSDFSVVYPIILKKMKISEGDIQITFNKDISPGCFNHFKNQINIDTSLLFELSLQSSFDWMQNYFYNALVHELQHYKQYLNNKLFCIDQYVIWSKAVYLNPLRTKNRKRYFTSPWEVDANETSEKIVNALIKEKIIKKNSVKKHTKNLFDCSLNYILKTGDYCSPEYKSVCELIKYKPEYKSIFAAEFAKYYPSKFSICQEFLTE